MAKSLLRTYVFTPGLAGVGTVKIPGKIDLSQILLITNTTRNAILYNFANVGNIGTLVSFTRGSSSDFPLTLLNSEGYTTVTLAVNTTGQSSADIIQIFVDVPYQLTRLEGVGTDAFQRQRVANPLSMIDADFEYGLQPTKWQALSMIRNYPSVYEVPGSDTPVVTVATDASAATAGVGASLITVTTLANHNLLAGAVITIKGYLNTVLGFSRAEGSFIVQSVLSATSFTYYAKSKVGQTDGDVLSSTYTILRKGGFYTGSSIGVPAFSVSNASTPSVITVTFTSPHGLVPGQTILSYITSTGSNHGLAAGPMFVEATPSLTTLTYTARALGTIDTTTTMLGVIYSRPDTFFLHRPFDGGVQLGTGTPAYGSQAIRMSKKYIRYQSGKAINYNTGLLLAPSYDIRTFTTAGGVAYGTVTGCAGGTTTITVGSTTGLAAGQSVVVSAGSGTLPYGTTIVSVGAGSILINQAPTTILIGATLTYSATITVETDDTDHGLQPGAYISIYGATTSGVNGFYYVAAITDERTFKVAATQELGNATITFNSPCQVSLQKWHGSTVRAGTFDEQNGQFWQYDGQTVSLGQRSSTFQLAGVVAVTPDSNTITGTNTRFTNQLVSGDRIVIKGMTHLVANIVSDTLMYVTPDFRGVNAQIGVKMVKTIDKIYPQHQWNMDRMDGSGSVFNPSGFLFDVSKMQMVGIQWTWYGAGFIDWMMRGPSGDYVTVHRQRNGGVNTEAYMRSGNQPVRYEVINEGPRSYTTSTFATGDLTITIADNTNFPPAGALFVEGEIVTYTGKSGTTQLTGCTRGTAYSLFQAGAYRSFQGMAAKTEPANTGVMLVGLTATPSISHWGSAFIQDGGFDSDRGYLFNYAATNISVSTTKQTAFLIRLAPSVSNATTGDLGDRELLNRAQLLLAQIDAAIDSGVTGGIVIEGILNPSNYPINPTDISWNGLTTQAAGGQPSFSQIAPGGSVSWNGGGGTTTTAVTTAEYPTSTITATSALFGANSINNGLNYFFITTANRDTYIAAGLTTGDEVSGSNVPSNTVISSIVFQQTGYYRVTLNRNFTGNTGGNATLTVTRKYAGVNTSVLFFQTVSWNSSGATQGTPVSPSDTLFPAGTSVNSVVPQTFFGTSYYRVTFTQTSSSGVTITPATTTVTFQFGFPPYALPGETVFSFIATSGALSSLSLNSLKELTSSAIGGRGTFPNGPDVLAINIYKTAGAAVPANIVLRWGEAQA